MTEPVTPPDGPTLKEPTVGWERWQRQIAACTIAREALIVIDDLGVALDEVVGYSPVTSLLVQAAVDRVDSLVDQLREDIAW